MGLASLRHRHHGLHRFPNDLDRLPGSFQASNGELFTTTATNFPNFPRAPVGQMGSWGLTSIALDASTTPATLYVSSLREGIFKSTDGGGSFSPTAFNIAGVTSITINNNTTPHTLFWTTGSAGIFESTSGLRHI